MNICAKKVGQIFSSKRKAYGYNQVRIAELLRPFGIETTVKSVSRWEHGDALPPLDVFFAWCKILNIQDIMGVFTDGEEGPFAGLNGDGIRHLTDYADLLKGSEKYVKSCPHTGEVRMIPLYSLAVSAGTGQFLDGEDYELTRVGSDVPAAANFGVRIAGNSMEPSYHDGQVVWVRQQRELNAGDIGVFLYDGCAYIKQLRSGSEGPVLHSLNSDYSDIIISPELPLRVFGKVIG